MSLEDKIDLLIAALDRNTAKWGPVVGTAQAATTGQTSTTPAAEPAKAKTTKKATAATTEAKPITAKEVADEIMLVANTISRDEAVAILTQFKVQKVGQLKPEHYPAVLRLVAEAKAKAAAVPTEEPESDSLI